MCVLGLEICILPVRWHIRKTNTCAALALLGLFMYPKIRSCTSTFICSCEF